MKIGVLSDTHLREPNSEFKKMIESHFRDVEKIFHAGDFVDWSLRSTFRPERVDCCLREYGPL